MAFDFHGVLVMQQHRRSIIQALLVFGYLLFQISAFSILIPTKTRLIASASPYFHSSSRRVSTLLFSSSKWDNLVDEDEGPPVPYDMKYVERNVRRQHENFVAIREAGGASLTNDVYVQEPNTDIFWFVGKVARVSDVTVEQAVSRQWNLIETHATNLRPLELFSSRGSLEIWTAPGDSELEVAYNRPDIVFQKMEREVNDGTGKIKNNRLGFQGEMYGPGEQGFRTWRLPDGRPAKPEIQTPSEEKQPPTNDEMEQLEKALEGKDINDIYEQQQRRQEKS